MADEPWEPSEERFDAEPKNYFFGCLMFGCGGILALTGGSCAILALQGPDWTTVLIGLAMLAAGVAAIAKSR